MPDGVEISMCQLCTELSQQASVESEILGYWMEQMAYGYHEVKVYLATEIFESARHQEVFRKRALANGGGLGLESRSQTNKAILESRGGWTEACLLLYLVRGTLTLTLYRYGEAFAHNPAEKFIFSHCIQDKSRHLAYGLAHLRYAVSHRSDEIPSIHHLLEGVELQVAKDLSDPALFEPLAIIFGDGLKEMRSGIRYVNLLIKGYVIQYLNFCDGIGVPRRDVLSEGLSKYLES